MNNLMKCYKVWIMWIDGFFCDRNLMIVCYYFQLVVVCCLCLFVGMLMFMMLVVVMFVVGFLLVLQVVFVGNNVVVDVFCILIDDIWIECCEILVLLGIILLLVLVFNDSSCEFYLLVLFNVLLVDVNLKFDVKYLCVDGGCIIMVLVIDIYLVVVCVMIVDQGDVSLVLGIDGVFCVNGFVCMGVNWIIMFFGLL